MDPIFKLPNALPITPSQDLGKVTGNLGESTPDGVNFGDILKDAIQEVNAAQNAATQEARNLMTGEATDMHSAILAVQKADVSFQMMMAVRTKLIDAYREVMRMQM